MKKRILACFTALALICSMVVLPATAESMFFSDIEGHWAQETIEKWAQHGLVAGYSDGRFGPDDDVTRGELAMILSRLMRYQTQAENTYADLRDDAWYTKAVLEATRAGVLRGDGVNARPEAKITREEVMVIFARILNLSDSRGAPNFTDRAAVADWAGDAVDAMTARGYVQGNGGAIRPKEYINRAEVLTILDHVFAALYDVDGTFRKDVAGNVVVNTPGVVLENMTISGDLLVAQGVGEGGLTLRNVKILGSLIVRGGAQSIYLTSGSAVGGTVSLEKLDGKVRIVSDGQIKTAFINDGSGDVILEGDFDEVALHSPNATVTLIGTADNLTVGGHAADTVIEVPQGSAIATVETEADGVTVRGSGKVGQVTVNAGEGVKVDTPNTTVAVSSEAGAVDMGGKTVQPGQVARTEPGTDGENGKVVVSDYYPDRGVVTLAPGSDPNAVAGNGRITGLTPGAFYTVVVGNEIRFVRADGTPGSTIADLAPLSGTVLTGLSNDRTYKVVKAAPFTGSVLAIAHDGDNGGLPPELAPASTEITDGVLTLDTAAAGIALNLQWAVAMDRAVLGGADNKIAGYAAAYTAGSTDYSAPAAGSVLGLYAVGFDGAPNQYYDYLADADTALVSLPAGPKLYFFDSQTNAANGGGGIAPAYIADKALVYLGDTAHAGWRFFVYADGSATWLKVVVSGAAVTPTVPDLAGSAVLTGTPTFGQTMTVTPNVTNPAAGETLVYTWKRGASVIAAAAGVSYTLAAADVGQTMTCEITSNLRGGKIISNALGPVAKAAGETPAVPAASAVTSQSITVAALTVSTGQTVLYAISTDGGKSQVSELTGWDAQHTFSALTPDTAYYVYAYAAESDTHLAGAMTRSDAVRTHAEAGSDFNATVTVTIDGAAGDPTSVKYGTGTEAAATAMTKSATGTYTATGVAPGEYKIFVNGMDTGSTFSDATPVAIHLFTVTFDALSSGTGTNGAITAKYKVGGAAIANNDPVLSGTEVTFAVVRTVETDTIAWGGSASGSGLTADVIYNAVTAKVTCVLTAEVALSARETLNFNFGWRFSKGQGLNNSQSVVDPKNQPVTVIANGTQVYQVDYATTASNWSDVSLPHTFNDVDTFDNFTEKGGTGHNGERSMYTGTSWYKKTFTLPASYEGKRVYIEFEAARQAADVYVNGVKLEGRSENGFIPFGYDITDYLNPAGVENDITVMVDNSFPYLSYNEDCTESGCVDAGHCEGHVLSWHDSHWHPTYGGLYRNVTLHVTDPLHVTLPLYSFLETQGTYVYTTNETQTAATVNAESEIVNHYTTAKTFTYQVEVLDMSGAVVLTVDGGEKTLEAGEKAVYKASGTLNNAKRWSDAYPYLYTVRASVLVAGEAVDVSDTTLGIRTFRFTNDQGFFANGNYTKFQGWGQKSTNEWAGLGAAYPDWMQDITIKLMKDAGGNFIRWGHTAGSPTQIAISDKYGLYVEQPGVDGEGVTVGGVYSKTAYDVRSGAFRDMIIYFRNSPSIVMWELGNQSVPDAEAAALRAIVEQYDHHGSDPGQSAARANSGKWDAVEESSQRGVAVRRGNDVMVPYVNVAISTEGSGGMGASLGNKPSVEGEYNREEARRGVWDRYTPGFEDYKTDSKDYNLTTEQFAANQIIQYAKIGGVAHNGGANWIFSDSLSHGRVFSEVARVSGEVDGVMLPKEAYYALQTVFTDEVDIYLIGHWNYPASTVKPVYVASDADSVELFLNGDSLGKGVKSNNYLFTFANVSWEAGELRAVGYDKSGAAIDGCVSIKQTHGEPAALKLTPIVGPQGLLANGSDVLLIDVEVVDAAGNRCLTYDGSVLGKYTHFTINDENGSSIWRGGYNAGVENSINNKYLYVEAGIARVAVRTTMTAGEIVVTAETEGLASDTVRVNAIAVDNTGGISNVLGATPAYDLSKLVYPGVGDGGQSGNQDSGNAATYRSALITEFGYTGPGDAKLATPAIAGKQPYSDEKNIKFGYLPIHLLNSDYLQFPNADAQTAALDLVVFITLKAVDVYVAYDSRITEKPHWLTAGPQNGNPFAPTGETIEIDGVTYDIYKSSAPANASYTIGGNVENGEDADGKRMFVMFFKAAGAQTDFFGDDFNDQDLDSVPLGWFASEAPPLTEGGNRATAQVKQGTGENRVLELYDNIRTVVDGRPNMAVVYSEFLPLHGKFSIEYKFCDNNLTVDTVAQNYVGIFLTNGAPSTSDPNDHSATVVESYIMAGTRPMARRNTTASNDVYLTAAGALDTGTWYTLKYVVDMEAQRYTMSVYNAGGVLVTSASNLQFRNESSSINHIMIRSGGGSGTHVLFDDVKVELIDDGLSGFTVNGDPQAASQFTGSPPVYSHSLPSGTTVAPVITATARDPYATVDVVQATQTEGGTATITVTPLHGDALTYTINFTVAAAAEVESIRLNGRDYVPYQSSQTNYTVFLPPDATADDIPFVTATARGGEAVVTQADALPGTATVTLEGTTYTIAFEAAEYELYDDFDGVALGSAWTTEGEGKHGTISVSGGALTLNDTNAPDGNGMVLAHGALANTYTTADLVGKRIIMEWRVNPSNTQTYIRGLLSNGNSVVTSSGKNDMAFELYTGLTAGAGDVQYRYDDGGSTSVQTSLLSNALAINGWNDVRVEVYTNPVNGRMEYSVTVDNGTAVASAVANNATAIRKNIDAAGNPATSANGGAATAFRYAQFGTGGGATGSVMIAGVRVYVIDDIAAADAEVTGIKLGGKDYVLFDPAVTDYTVVLPPTATNGDIPTVTAATTGKAATVTQAATLPGTATVSLDGTTYTIAFKAAEYELYDDFSGVALDNWIQQPGGGAISIVTDAGMPYALKFEDEKVTADAASPGAMTVAHGTLANSYDNDSLKGKKIVLEYDVKMPGSQTFVRGLLSNGTDLSVNDGKNDLAAEVFLNLNASSSNAAYGAIMYRPANSTNTALSPALGKGTIAFNAWNKIKLELRTEDEFRVGSFSVTINNGTETKTGTATDVAGATPVPAVYKNVADDGTSPGTANGGVKTKIQFVQFATGNNTKGTVYFANVRVYVVDDI